MKVIDVRRDIVWAAKSASVRRSVEGKFTADYRRYRVTSENSRYISITSQLNGLAMMVCAVAEIVESEIQWKLSRR